MELRLLIAAMLVAIVFWLLVGRRRPRRALPPIHRWRHRVAIQEGRYPYYARKCLLTKSERGFYAALQEAAGDRFTIAMSVRLADVINCSRESWQAGHGALISSKQLDFVLCEPGSMYIRAAIELDDPTHGLAERRERDAFLDNAMKAAGVPLLRVRAAPRYDVQTLRQEIAHAVAGRPRHGKAA